MSAATIPLMGTPYQPANPVQQLGQLAQVQNLLQAGPQEAQLRQQQIDQNDYELKQRQAINNAYKSAVNVLSLIHIWFDQRAVVHQRFVE